MSRVPPGQGRKCACASARIGGSRAERELEAPFLRQSCSRRFNGVEGRATSPGSGARETPPEAVGRHAAGSPRRRAAGVRDDVLMRHVDRRQAVAVGGSAPRPVRLHAADSSAESRQHGVP